MNWKHDCFRLTVHRSAFIVPRLAKHRLPLRVVGAEVFDCAVAFVEGSVEVVRRAFKLRGGLLQAFGARALRAEFARLLLKRLDLLDEREVEAVNRVELRLLYLHNVEEARVAVRSEAHAVLYLVNLLRHAVERADLEQSAR